MRNYSDKISPDKITNTLLVAGIAVLGYLILAGYKGNLPITPHPAVTYFCGIAALLFRSKTIYFSNRQITIRRLIPIFNREILWDFVRHIEVVDDRYIFIVLDGCPSFQEAGKTPKAYFLSYSGSVIKIDIFTAKQKDTYVKVVQKYYPDICFVKSDTT